jgi:hypothetical protein
MALSYSFHIGSKKHAITSLKKLESVSKHNLRKFQSKIFDGSKNELLIGSNDLVKDTKKFYNDFFKNALDEYNKKQKRSDRKIKNYFNHVCDDVQKHIAVECIIQVGGYDFWEDKNLDERKKMTPIFRNQIEKLQKELPNFKIINAVIHYDEACPHVQLVGVPIKENCKRGLAVQVSKTSNFNKESLEVLQAKMREDIEKQMQDIYGKEINLKAKEKGRNQDLARETYIKQQELEKLQEEIDDLKGAKSLIDSDITDLLIYKDKLNENIKQKEKAKEKEEKEIEEKAKEKENTIKQLQNAQAEYKKFINTDKWNSVQTLKNFDSTKKVITPSLFNRNTETMIQLPQNNYNEIYKMAMDNSYKINSWYKKANDLTTQNAKLNEKITELENEQKDLKDENERLTKFEDIFMILCETKLETIIEQAKDFFENDRWNAFKKFRNLLGSVGLMKTKDKSHDNDFER